jgi:hypothetical protein
VSLFHLACDRVAVEKAGFGREQRVAGWMCPFLGWESPPANRCRGQQQQFCSDLQASEVVL